MRAPLSALVAFTLALAACGAAGRSPPRSGSRRTTPDASVTVDDQFVGTVRYVAKRGVALPPGTHRITVEKTGFFPWDKIVEVKEGDPLLRLQVVMEKIPD